MRIRVGSDQTRGSLTLHGASVGTALISSSGTVAKTSRNDRIHLCIGNPLLSNKGGGVFTQHLMASNSRLRTAAATGLQFWLPIAVRWTEMFCVP